MNTVNIIKKKKKKKKNSSAEFRVIGLFILAHLMNGFAFNKVLVKPKSSRAKSKNFMAIWQYCTPSKIVNSPLGISQ